MRIALAQTNPLVGDLSGNAKRLLEACLKFSQQAQGTSSRVGGEPRAFALGLPTSRPAVKS